MKQLKIVLILSILACLILLISCRYKQDEEAKIINKEKVKIKDKEAVKINHKVEITNEKKEEEEVKDKVEITNEDKEKAKSKAKEYIYFASLPYCDPNNLKSNTCSICNHIRDMGFKIIDVETQQSMNINFSMVIAQSNHEEFVISFGGPKSEDVIYMQQIYANGMSEVPEINNLIVEKEFWKIYSTFFRKILHSKISELTANATKILFVGHSFGGSMATLAIYDLLFNNIFEKDIGTFIFLYTFGALKIGAKDFIMTVQEQIPNPIVRIKKSKDFFTKIPRCIYIPDIDLWRCYTNYTYLVEAFPMLTLYYISYSPLFKKQFRKTVPNLVKNSNKYISKYLLNSEQAVSSNQQIPIPNPFQQTNKTPLNDNLNDQNTGNQNFSNSPIPNSNNKNIVAPNNITPNFMDNKIHPNQSSQALNTNIPSQIHNPAGSNNNILSNPNKSVNISNSGRRNYRGKRSFLEKGETTIVTKRRDTNFDNCEKKTKFVNCKFNPQVHKMYLGINIEECD